MNVRNPRSKLRQMKRRYFAATMLVYLFIFFIIYLVCQILFMIFEAGPYVRLSVVLMFLVIDGVVTDYIINQRLKNRWKREAPDILDEIKAPEPAYIPDGPAVSAENNTADTSEKKRFHRTQHKELELEKRAAGAEDVGSVRSSKEKTAEKPANKLRLSGLFHKKENSVPVKAEAASEDKKPEPAAIQEPEQERRFLKSLDEMDTVNLEDAVMDLEDRIEHSEPVRASVPPHKENIQRKKTDRSSDSGRAESKKISGGSTVSPEAEKTQSAVKEEASDNRRQRLRPQPPKPSVSSAWSASIDEMETVGITEAVSRIEQSEAELSSKEAEHVPSGSRVKRRKSRRG